MKREPSKKERRSRAFERLRERLPDRRREWLERRTRPLPTHGVVALSNMHPLRADFILVRLGEENSFHRAIEASKGTYDTCYWGEFVSRLARARGSVLSAVARLARQRVVSNGAPQDLAEVVAIARQLRSTATRFFDAVRTEPIETSDSRIRRRKVGEGRRATKATISRSELLRAFRQADALVAKNLRDLPRVAETIGTRLTLRERSVMVLEAGRIIEGAALLETIATSSAIAGRKARFSSGDARGIGAAYADSIDAYLLRLPNLMQVHAPETMDLGYLFALWVREREFARSSVVVIDYGASANESVDTRLAVLKPSARGRSPSLTAPVSSLKPAINSWAGGFVSSSDPSMHDRGIRRLASRVEALHGKHSSKVAASLLGEFEGLRQVADSAALLYRGLAAVFDSEFRRL